MKINYDNATLDLTSPTMYQYYKGLSERTIVINEAIMPEVLENVILPLLEMDNDGSGEPITLILNTEDRSYALLYSGMGSTKVSSGAFYG